MTYPEIGNVGVNREDVESRRPVRARLHRRASTARRRQLARRAEPRRLPARARHPRHRGHRHARAGPPPARPRRAGGGPLERRPRRRAARARAKARPGLVGRDLVREVTCAEPYDWEQGPWTLGGYVTRRRDRGRAADGRRSGRRLRLRHQAQHPAQPGRRRLPRARRARRTRRRPTCSRSQPDGVFLSNGPGDPDAVAGAPENVAALLGKVPIFGICLGHQILGLALGGTHLQAQVRPPRRQPAGAGPDDRQGRDHLAEPRLRGRRRLAAAAAPS